jgi:hypothetical protein
MPDGPAAAAAALALEPHVYPVVVGLELIRACCCPSVASLYIGLSSGACRWTLLVDRPPVLTPLLLAAQLPRLPGALPRLLLPGGRCCVGCMLKSRGGCRSSWLTMGAGGSSGVSHFRGCQGSSAGRAACRRHISRPHTSVNAISLQLWVGGRCLWRLDG